MKTLSLSSSFHLALAFSLSFTSFSYSRSLSFPLQPKPSSLHFSLSSSSSHSPKATAADIISLLGTEEQASKIDPDEAQELWSCFRFLVPFHKNSIDGEIEVKRRSMSGQWRESGRQDEENEMIWRPPVPVLELARLAVDSGGDPDAIHRALDPTIISVPDVEGSNGSKCELTRTPYGRHFISEELNAYIKFLFELIVSRGPNVGLNVSLTRYDFFHGHLFLAKDTGRLGILFHAKEYPAYDKQNFPLNMGYCQTGSDVAYDSMMNLRNILWLAPLPSNSSRAWVAPGVLVVLDASPEGIVYRDLIPDYVQIARTLYEDDFGKVAVDVNYLNVGTRRTSKYQLFVC